MPHQILAPVIVIAINLPLAVWALVTRPKEPAYRVFAALGLSLVVWNVGGALCWYAGPDQAHSGLSPEAWGRLRAMWLRLSFIGALLVPPNMIHLALVCKGRRWLPGLRPGLWLLLAYLPAIIMGVALDLDFVRSGAVTNSWRRAFYDPRDAGALAVLVLVGVYMAATVALAWPNARAPRQERKQARTILHIIVAPWVLGVVSILVFGLLRRERAPTAALWMMILSQAAMLQLGRLGFVSLHVDRERWVRLFLIVIMVGAAVLLASVGWAWLFERKVSIETALVLTICIVGACHVFAAVFPKLDALAKRLASRGRTEQD